jgi:hypothetical protein
MTLISSLLFIKCLSNFLSKAIVGADRTRFISSGIHPQQNPSLDPSPLHTPVLSEEYTINAIARKLHDQHITQLLDKDTYQQGRCVRTSRRVIVTNTPILITLAASASGKFVPFNLQQLLSPSQGYHPP